MRRSGRFLASGFADGAVFEAVAFAGHGEDRGVMQEAVEDGSGGGHVLKQFAPVLERTVARHDGRARLVAAHDDFEQILAGVLRQGAQAHVVDDEQVALEVGLQDPVPLLEGVLGEEVAHQIEDGAVADGEALLDGLVADGLGQVGLAGAGRPDEEHVVFGADKVAGRQLVDRLAGDRGIEAPIKLVQGLERAEVRGLDPALDLALGADVDLVLQGKSQKLLVRKPVGERLLEAHRQGLAQAGEP